MLIKQVKNYGCKSVSTTGSELLQHSSEQRWKEELKQELQPKKKSNFKTRLWAVL